MEWTGYKCYLDGSRYSTGTTVDPLFNDHVGRLTSGGLREAVFIELTAHGFYLASSTFEWLPGVRFYHSRDLVTMKEIP